MIREILFLPGLPFLILSGVVWILMILVLLPRSIRFMISLMEGEEDS